MNISPSLVCNDLKKIPSVSLNNIKHFIFVAIPFVFSVHRLTFFIRYQTMFGSPVHTIEDSEGDIVVIIILNFLSSWGIQYFGQILHCQRTYSEMWNWKSINRLSLYFQTCIYGIQMHVLIVWIDTTRTTIRFFSCIYSRTCNPSTLIPCLLSQ